jgi:gas vesicle protein
METEERKHNYFLSGLCIGGVLGGLAGLFFAPRSGKELRAEIKGTGERTFRETKAFIDKAGHQVSDVQQKARNILSCMKERGETAPGHAFESAEEYVGEA